MATTVDERIVAAKFDASDFEKGVNKTIKKLDELKKSLNLKDATKSVEELAEKTEASTSSMSKSLDTLTDRFTTFTGMIKQKILGGLADEVAGVFLKMEQSVTSFIKSISTDQIGAGLSKYQQLLTSVRVMVSSGVSETDAYKSLEDLTGYVDQTSYSLTQMTDALSKMVSAGLKGEDGLEVATKAVQGIGNACADAGINAQDAQRAFYNLAQAYGKGKLEYTDYKSLELLNMTSANFKQNLLDAAVEVGTLQKVSEGVYKTSNKVDKKVKAGKKVTKENLTDMLRYDFVNTDVMNNLFGSKYYFSDKELDAIYAEMGTTKYEASEQQKEKAFQTAKERYSELAVQAYLAAREARSFTDVVNALKDAVSTGWSKTFEHLFGQLERAKDFFTALTEGELAEAIYMIGTWRNAVLESWNELDAEGNGTGGEAFRQTILNITDAIGTLLQALGIVDAESEDGAAVVKDMGEHLKIITIRIRNFSYEVKEAAERFKEWMNSPVTENGPTRIEILRDTIANLSSILGILGKTIVTIFHSTLQVFNALSPIFDGFIIFLNKVTEPLVDLRKNEQPFKDIEASVTNLSTALRPVAEILGQVIGFLGDVGAFFAQMAIDTAVSNISFFSDVLGLFMELITGESAQKLEDGEGVLGRIKNDFEGIKDACKAGLGAVSEFFGALLSDIRQLLGLTDEAEDDAKGKEGGIFSGLINFFNTNQFVQDAKAWVNQAIIDVGDFIKSIPDRVKKFGANIYDTLKSLFFTEETRYNGSMLETKTVLTPLGEWLAGVIEEIKNFIISIPQRIIDGVGQIGSWIDDVFNVILGKESVKDTNASTKNADKASESVEKAFDDFIASVFGSIKEWFDDLPNKIRTGLSSIGDFFSKLYEKIDEFLFGKKIVHVKAVKNDKGGWDYKTVTKRYKTGFSEFLDKLVKEVKKFIENIPEYIKSAIKGAGDIVSVIVNALFGKDPSDKTPDSKDVQEKLEAPFLGIDISGILETIKDIGITILNQIARIFTGSEDIEVNQEWFSNLIADGIKWIREKAEKAFNWVLEFIPTIPTRIANLFSGENTEEQGPVGKAISGFGEAVGGFIASLPETISNFLTNALKEIGNVWDTIYGFLIGELEDSSSKTTEEAVKATYPDAMKGDPRFHVKSKWETFVESIGKLISTAFEELPVWIAKGIELAIAGIDKIIGNIGEWLNGNVSEKDVSEGASNWVADCINAISKATETTTRDSVEAMANTSEKAGKEEEPALLKAIRSIGERIKKLFVETIPGAIQAAWAEITSLASDIWFGVGSVFTGDPPDNERQQAVADITTKIKGFIDSAIAEITKVGSGVWDGLSSLFTGSVPTTEIGTAVNEFGKTIYKFIVEDIPKFLKQAFDYISNLFNGKDPLEESLNLLPDADRAYVSRYVDKMKKDNKALEESDAGKSGFWTFVESLKNTLVGAIESIGPTILDAIDKVAGWIGNIFTLIINALTGKESIGDGVERLFGKEEPGLRQSLKNIGESLKNFFLDTVPKFIGSVIGTLVAEAPKWFEKLFGAMNEAKDEAEKKAISDATSEEKSPEQQIQSVSGIFGFIKQFIESIGKIVTSDTATAIAVVVGVAVLIHAIKDLFSIADEVEAVGYTAKWTAITLAIIAITGILGYLKDLINNGTEEQINKFEIILDKLGSLFEKILWLSGILTLKEFFGMISDLGGGDNIYNYGDDMGFAGKLLGGLGNAFTSITQMLGFAAGANIAGTAVNATIDQTVTTLTQSLTELGAGVSGMLDLVTPFVDDLVELNDDLDTAVSSVEKLSNLFVAFFDVFSTLYQDASGDPNALLSEMLRPNGQSKPTSDRIKLSTEEFVKELESRVDLYVKISQYMTNLAQALNSLQSVPDAQGKIDDFAKVVTSDSFKSLMTGMFDTLVEAWSKSKIKPNETFTVSDSYRALQGLEMLASALSVFTGSISGLTTDQVTALKSSLDVLGELASALEGASVQSSWSKVILGNKTLSAIGLQIKLFGSHMKSFYGYIQEIQGFKEDEYEETSRKIDSVIQLAQGMAVAANTLEAMLTGEDLATMGSLLPDFGKNLGAFVNSFKTSLDGITPEDMDMLTKAAESIANVGNLIALSVYNDPNTLAEHVYKGFTGENGLKIAAGLRGFINQVHNAFTNEEAMNSFIDTGKNIASFLYTGIQGAFDEDPNLSITITPVLNMENIKTQMASTFGVDNMSSIDFSGLASAVAGANNQTDLDRIDSSLLYLKIDNITSAVDRLTNKQVSVTDVTNAFAGMRIVTDTGALVGAIADEMDSALGNKIWLIQHGVTVAGQ